ncbi:aldo/keto reductase [Pleomorphovibrio marinus]|uniref:aldo/keto reductase n=1 Tax=Pleomorphovibrio marinus TaxID=2164132 RepID=UPI000E0A3EB5|nr:aldo/keto reductase [Pleomorphovibrio marinus]
MKEVKLGKFSLKSSPIIFGCNVFGWTLNETESFDMLDRLLDMGLDTLDTADVYSRWVEGNRGGESESIIGKWMKQNSNREKINLITKVGSDMGQGKKDLSEPYILKAVEESLRRLQTDYIDIYLTHWDDDLTPVEETLGAYDKLLNAGKIRAIGACNLSKDRLSASLKAHKSLDLPKYEVFQPEYNLYDRDGYEKSTLKICEEEGLGVICYYSLAMGFLSGKYRTPEDKTKSQRGEAISKKYMNDKGWAILRVMDKLAEKHQVCHSAIALSWLMHQPMVSAPIASATKYSHLRAFEEALTLKLEPEDLQALDMASKP